MAEPVAGVGGLTSPISSIMVGWLVTRLLLRIPTTDRPTRLPYNHPPLTAISAFVIYFSFHSPHTQILVCNSLCETQTNPPSLLPSLPLFQSLDSHFLSSMRAALFFWFSLSLSRKPCDYCLNFHSFLYVVSICELLRLETSLLTWVDRSINQSIDQWWRTHGQNRSTTKRGQKKIEMNEF